MDPTPYIIGFGLVFTRVAAFIMSCPLFISDSVATTIRTIVSLLLALAIYIANPVASVPDIWVVALVVEVLLGSAFGLCTRLISLSINFAGELIDTNMGFGFARILNPMLSEETGPIMHLAQLLGGLVFYLVGGQHMVILGLSRSFVLFPAGSGDFRMGWVSLLCDHYAEMLACGILLAMPVVMTLMATQAGLALLSRVAPQMNLWSLGLLGTCGMGLLALWCATPAWVSAIASVWQMSGNGFLAVGS
jgi:flagellar biosynthetic protein FliR